MPFLVIPYIVLGACMVMSNLSDILKSNPTPDAPHYTTQGVDTIHPPTATPTPYPTVCAQLAAWITYEKPQQWGNDITTEPSVVVKHMEWFTCTPTPDYTKGEMPHIVLDSKVKEVPLCINDMPHNFEWLYDSWGSMDDPQGVTWKHARYQKCKKCGYIQNWQGAKHDDR